MGVAINAVACLLLIAFSPAFAEIDCEKSVHEVCQRDLSFYAAYAGFGASEQFLEEHCSDLQEDWSCKDDYLRTCDPDNYKVFELLLNGVTNMFTHLCNETSDLRIGFRQNVDCIQGNSDKFKVCIPVAVEAAHRRTSIDSSSSYDSGLEVIAKLCKLQGPLSHCTVRLAKHYCGKGAGQYVSLLYDITFQDWLSQQCQSK